MEEAKLTTVVEMPEFIRQGTKLFDDSERHRLVDFLATHPTAGDLIQGTGGLRKLRWTMTGRGKRGGARVIYYWLSDDDRIYLVHAYAKNETADLTPAQIRQLAALMIDEVER